MIKRMLINATQSEELRVAIVDAEHQTLLDLIVDRKSYKAKIGNVYMGKITSVEPSLNAAFVNFGSERHGFLPLKEISREYFLSPADPKKSDRPPHFKELLKEGQAVMVQVEREERGSKGAALTTYISLAGSYSVLMPNNPRAGGISRRVEGEERDELRETLSSLALPEGMGLIIRTAGVGKTIEELQWDLNTLLRQWEAIKKASIERSPPFLVHQESDVVIRTIRDYLRDVIEIFVDDVALFDKVKTHLEQIRPDFLSCLKLYSGSVPLFNRYQIEHQIESAHQRELRLPSGGSIVIDHTEALVAIDVNSARATQGSDIEETAIRTNLEAAERIACQLRLRDIGGLVVIDFIDMSSMRHRREVENHLRNALKLDKARTQVGTISPRFGLLEMSRQRLRASLGEATQVICPRCSGWGTIRGIESLALSIIRMIEEDAVKPNTAQVQIQLPIDVATFVINEKRDLIISIEKHHNVQIVIIPNPEFESPRYKIKRISEEESSGGSKLRASYHVLTTQETEQAYKKSPQSKAEEKPAVKNILPVQPAPSNKKPGTNIIKRLISSLFGALEEEEKSSPSTPATITETAINKPRHQHNPSRQHPHRSSHSRPQGQAQSQPTTSSSTPIREVASKIASKEQPKEPLSKELPLFKEEKSLIKSDEETPQIDAKTRTRRGARGGRRRISSGNYAKSVKPEIKPENPPPHLPPFPNDLEDYYQESVRFGKQGGPRDQTQQTPPLKSTEGEASVTAITPIPVTAEKPVASTTLVASAPLEKPVVDSPKIIDKPLLKNDENQPLIIRAHTNTEEPITTTAPPGKAAVEKKGIKETTETKEGADTTDSKE